MKLTRIKIDGYKNLTNCELLFEDFNVLIGTNNSGKSNVLEVFLFLDTLLSGSEETKQEYLFWGNLPEKGVIIPRCKNTMRDDTFIELEFTDLIKQSVFRFWYSLSIHFGDIKTRGNEPNEIKEGYISQEVFKYKNVKSTGVPITVFERTGDKIKKLSGQRFQKINKKETVLFIINKLQDIKDQLDEPIRKGIDDIFTICKTPVIYNSPNEIRNFIQIAESKPAESTRYGRIVALNLTKEIKKVLNSENANYYKEVLDDLLSISDISNFEIKDFNIILIEFANGVPHTLDQLSDGSLIVLNLVTYLFSNKYPIIAIEELENSIHPQLLRKLIYLIKNSFPDTQAILTTHSPVLIDIVKIDEVNIVTNNQFGEAKIERVKDKKHLVKKLSGTFASFGDIFDFDYEDIED